jgi:hypothetical protein
MSEHPTIQKPLPVYASKPEGLTNKEWESDTRTQELLAHTRRLELILNCKD